MAYPSVEQPHGAVPPPTKILPAVSSEPTPAGPHRQPQVLM